jgi:hypothetical protein
MDNPETMETLGTQDTEWRQTNHNKKHNTKQKTKMMSNTDPTNRWATLTPPNTRGEPRTGALWLYWILTEPNIELLMFILNINWP